MICYLDIPADAKKIKMQIKMQKESNVEEKNKKSPDHVWMLRFLTHHQDKKNLIIIIFLINQSSDQSRNVNETPPLPINLSSSIATTVGVPMMNHPV